MSLKYEPARFNPAQDALRNEMLDRDNPFLVLSSLLLSSLELSDTKVYAP